jgi:predicted nucleic acid-binding protein
MTFASIPAAVFVDANTFIYHFTNDPNYGVACTQLLKRVELQQVRGFTSAHVMAEVAHRLMTLEAISLKGWPVAGKAAKAAKTPCRNCRFEHSSSGPRPHPAHGHSSASDHPVAS